MKAFALPAIKIPLWYDKEAKARGTAHWYKDKEAPHDAWGILAQEQYP